MAVALGFFCGMAVTAIAFALVEARQLRSAMVAAAVVRESRAASCEDAIAEEAGRKGGPR